MLTRASVITYRLLKVIHSRTTQRAAVTAAWTTWRYSGDPRPVVAGYTDLG
jgi:hypothetical protein